MFLSKTSIVLAVYVGVRDALPRIRSIIGILIQKGLSDCSSLRLRPPEFCHVTVCASNLCSSILHPVSSSPFSLAQLEVENFIAEEVLTGFALWLISQKVYHYFVLKLLQNVRSASSSCAATGRMFSAASTAAMSTFVGIYGPSKMHFLRYSPFNLVSRALRNQGNRNRDASRRIVPVDTPTNALVVQDGISGYDWSFQVKEGITNFVLMAYTSQGYQIGLESLEAMIVVHEKNEVVYEEDIAFLKYDVQVKDISIKDLKNHQISAKDKAGLGYDSQINESEVVYSVFNSKESDVDDSPVNDRFKTGEGFHAVPPPYTRNYMPSRPDLSFTGLDDSVYKTKVSETITTASKTNKDSLEKPKTVRHSAPIIEEWDTDSDNDSVFRPKTDQTKPKFTKINFVKSDENVKSVNKENTHKQVEYPRKSQSPSEKPVLNNKGRVTGQREFRPVWNNAQRVNHQNKLTHPHPKRNFVPTTIATKSGQVPVNAAKQNSPRAAASISTSGYFTACPKSKVNDALPKTYSYFKAHSPVRRDFNQKSTAKTNNLNEKVKTAVVSAAVGNGENAVKSLACWIWRPTGNDQGIFDSGCSRHMTRNKSFLTDYQEINGGFVAFAGSPKGGKITGKEFKNNDMNQFCGMKGIKREFSVARTPQQNGVAERKNRTQIEAARTMLADSLLPTTFWVEVAFRVFNTRTKKVEENLHINFYENKPNVVGNGPDWLFDIDLLTTSMNYEPVTAGNQTNKNAGIKDNVDAIPAQQYILLPLLYDSPQSSKDAVADDAGKKTNEEPANEGERNGQEKEGGASNKEDDQNVQDFRDALDNLLVQQKKGYPNSTNRDSTISPSVSTAGQSFTNADDLPTDPLMTDLKNTGIFSGAYDDEDVGLLKVDLNMDKPHECPVLFPQLRYSQGSS
ncbi:ribonuclease H-like domain-containing protein [Tanacetum coccineum]